MSQQTALIKPTLIDPRFPHWNSGKVRELYESGPDRLLIVTTDRISAFDVVLDRGILGKGIFLNQISTAWFRRLEFHVPNHLLCNEPPKELADYPELEGRSVIVQRAKVIPFECVVRGFISGSGWKDYQVNEGVVGGIKLPPGLRESDRLWEPVFSPATKAEAGHDENVSFDRMVQDIGGERAEELRDISLLLYNKADVYARSKGLILADTKFEFGISPDGRLLWIDEALTPDSSRYWEASTYQPGGPQPSYDKQFVRDYLESVGWDKQLPAPVLPDEVIAGTIERYRHAHFLLT